MLVRLPSVPALPRFRSMVLAWVCGCSVAPALHAQGSPLPPLRVAAPESLPRRHPFAFTAGDSSAIYTAALMQGLDSVLAQAGRRDYWLELPSTARSEALRVYLDRQVMAGRLRGFCFQTQPRRCPRKYHRAIALGALERQAEDSVAVPFSIGWGGKEPASVEPFSDAWMTARRMEVGIWPAERVLRDGVFELAPRPRAIVLRRVNDAWHVTGFRRDMGLQSGGA